ncbi:MAG: FIST C-terminal domain-containing protein [Rhodospirillales bacterium]|nr:FIST C-terminal domain-containing protein [Rhodospirillales bacterium]
MYVGKGTCVRRGYSRSRDPARAARELFDSIYHPDASLGVFFCSTDYDLPALAAELDARFTGIPLIGCTSAGEITPAGYMKGSVAGFSLARPDFAAVAAPIRNLRRFSIADGQEMVRTLRDELEASCDGSATDNTFALLLIDGLCKREEVVLSAISSALGDIPLFGGSASGGMTFQRSYVFHRGQFHADAAILVLVSTRLPIKLFTVDHFVSSETKMVVTEADPARRIVTEINAEPAGREYARLVGLEVDALTPMIFATHPVVVKVGGRYYTRSIQKVNPDESLTFFCAIDKGIVLTVAKGTDLLHNMRQLFDDIAVEIGPPQLVIGCDCILRALELEEKQLTAQADDMFVANNVVGFSTFGEQFHAMHVNQTFTGAAIGIGVVNRST